MLYELAIPRPSPVPISAPVQSGWEQQKELKQEPSQTTLRIIRFSHVPVASVPRKSFSGQSPLQGPSRFTVNSHSRVNEDRFSGLDDESIDRKESRSGDREMRGKNVDIRYRSICVFHCYILLSWSLTQTSNSLEAISKPPIHWFEPFAKR